MFHNQLWRIKFFSIIALAIGLLIVFQSATLAYGAWEQESNFDAVLDLDNLINDLSSMVKRATENRSAHPDFLADLNRFLIELQNYRQLLAGNYEPSYTSQPTKVTLEVKYLGRTADKVGDWEQTKPDGKNDDHVQIMVYFPQNTLVESIRIWTATAEGAPTATWWWSDSTGAAAPRRAWVLGVFQNNQMLNPNLEVNLGRFVGWTLFDLYCSPQGGSFDQGKYLLVQVTDTDGNEYKTVFQSRGIEQPFSQR